MDKKYGGTIKDWQVHHLTISKEKLNKGYKANNLIPEIVTGTVVEDPIGRWRPGFHMRSSAVVKIDRDKGILETRNTIYDLTGTENNDIIPDLGNAVMDIFY